MRKLTIFIIILAVVIGIIGFYYYQRNIYSKEVMKLEILGPEETELLKEIEYVVKFKNNGNVSLEEPELIFDYPEYTVPTDYVSLRVVKKSEELGGAIYPGQEKTFIFKGRLMGKEGEVKEAKVSLNYSPKNLRARYTSKTSFTTIIKKIPLNLEFDLPAKVESGKTFSLNLNYFSNTDYPLSDLRIFVEYPSGFEFIDSNPKSLEKTEWEIGLLNQTQGGRIQISGRLSAAIGEEKIFRAKIGSWKDGNFIVLKDVSKGISIIKPTLYITQEINGNPKLVANPGDLLHYEISFKNIGEQALNDLFLLVTLNGSAFDFSTTKTLDGDFTSGDNTIIWDWRRVSKLQFLHPQEEGKVEFWIKLKDNWEIKSLAEANPQISSTVFLSQVKETFANKVNSKLVILQKGYFNDEVFGNSGPLPPNVGQPTTYTISWQVKNYYNDTKDAKVKAVLPNNVSLTGKIFPDEQKDNLTFDSQSREIVWNIGDLSVGQGILSPSPSISFQISFWPDSSQIGQAPALINEARISGQDQFTGETLQATSPSVNTALPDDTTVTYEKSIVR
ncbi:MAG: hypothetical protein FJZ05_00455 [Candidatus Nealsonbacteria bacterium]|nr:hypothetical protein [Candidatus Nealsonbacteria bacterium]